jgi:hypothetical protein
MFTKPTGFGNKRVNEFVASTWFENPVRGDLLSGLGIPY